jgi:hypothetical protein
MRMYRYYADLSNGKCESRLYGRAENMAAFRAETEKKYSEYGLTVVRCGKCQPETKREKKFYSMAFVDMGQAARY